MHSVHKVEGCGLRPPARLLVEVGDLDFRLPGIMAVQVEEFERRPRVVLSAFHASSIWFQTTHFLPSWYKSLFEHTRCNFEQCINPYQSGIGLAVCFRGGRSHEI